MSTDKQVYPLYYEAKNDKVRKRLGIKGGFYWAEAKKLSIAISRGAVAIDDAGYDEDDFKKPVRVNLPVVDDLPPEGVFDTEFCNRYEKGGEDGITMVFIAPSSSAQDKPASTDNTNVNGEDMTEIEENMLLPISGQELPIRWLAQHGSEKPVTHVSRDELQALHIARAEELPAVTALAVSHKTSLLDPLEIRDLHKLVRDTDRVFPNPGNSSLGLMTAFFEAYLDADYTDRGLLTKEWMKGNRVSRITRTASGANAGGGNLTDRGEGFVHDLTSLARDVATGVLARSMDVDIYNLHPAHAKRVEEIIAENKPPFSVFRDKFITMPGGLDYSRAIVVASVKEAPIGIEVIPAHVTEYLNKVLIETDHANPDPEIVDIACGRSSAPMPQRVTEEGKHDGEEKPQPSCAMADKQATAETVEPDATEHHQDTQPLDAQSQVNSVDAKYQKLRAELHEARKTIPPKNPVDADKLLAASRGEFVEGISDPNDPKWVKGIETRDSVNQSQPESEQNNQKAEQNSPNAQKNEPETKQSEPVAQQEPEKVCAACGQSGGGNCPDCGAVMGDTTYQETFNEENLDESQEKDPEEMEGPEHPHNENAGSDPHRDCSDETGEVADPVIAGDIEPGIYYGISNENYHAGPGVSKSQLDDIADTPALYLWRKNAPVDTTKTKTLDLGTAFHCRVLEPEEFSNRFIVAPEFNRRTTAGKEEEKAFLMECASTGKTVITAEEGRKIELMYQSVMALPLGQWLVESAGHAESSIYWEDPETGILCRCRPDKIIPEFHWIMDVKTTADIQRFKTAYYDYRYHVQDAFYSDGYEAQFGVLPTFVFLVASTTVECGRYPVEIFMMGEEAKLAGQQEYHRNLRTLADCLNTDEWPAIKTLSLPRWAKEYAND
ncbi:exodeoxyribonuclease VIII [Salmonella enterica subsp. enterica serovar Montevideo]|uniref:Exodeoxyribonuclease VIII n=2 Tax=Salmonella enterica TaxID=28901 RepID=A0A5V2A3S0_SALER|nr:MULTISPECIES: exodeoxyribonuclease VIII [Enterobacteriaceae]EAZ9633269.1 exodeoxyribonuclease VIII [Salmonella enterica subsp. enterica serovar Typhimurium]EBB4443424.1 exodeoxyribonuclease VIII [Salmonella enterica subsp. enterica serovar Dublin]EBD0105728.1 exodeoxyribonuclease VIII [Salmonella enterica subsp. enterica serovar Montevideo]EBK6431984.1 exodeoxyribonuclease VIII [Salmonella enterica subsp. enterica serovar Newport]EBL0510009.1 exodeoxyribonuclease VIII [Salmonella enterica s